MQTLIDELADALTAIGAGKLLVVTGAGISRASGIATFRGSDTGAVWKTSDMALATFDYFQRDPVGQWQWYLKRFESVRDAEPNPAHHALVRLQEWFVHQGGALELVTQNIDTLHERAGTSDLIKVHGTSDRVRCSRPGCANGAPTGSLALSEVDFGPFEADPRLENLPVCPICEAFLRAHVLFFDEFYLEHEDYRYIEVESRAVSAHCILFVGTSFSVGVTDLFLQAGSSRRIPMFSIDPAQSGTPWSDLRTLPAPAEVLLPAVADRLAAHPGE